MKTAYSQPFDTLSLNELIGLYYNLIPRLEEIETLKQSRNTLEQHYLTTCDQTRISLLEICIKILSSLVVAAIPFLLAFYIVSNLIHTGSGASLFEVYDNWAGKLSFVKAFMAWCNSWTDGIFLSFICVSLLLIFCYIFVPCFTLLLPTVTAFQILSSIFTMIKSRSSINGIRKQITALNAQIEKKYNKISNALTFVPSDYQNSDALLFFCRCYENGMCSTVREAVILYDEHLYRKRIEDANQKAYDAQLNIMQELEHQSIKMNAMKKSLDRVKRKIDWL